LFVVFSLEIFLTAEQMVENSLQCSAPFAYPHRAELIKLRKTIQWQIEPEALRMVVQLQPRLLLPLLTAAQI